MTTEHKPHIRLMPDEIEALEGFAQTHGIPATLDHLGLDGLGNQVNGLLEQLETLRDEVQRFADLFPGDSHDWQYVQNWAKRVRSGSNPAKERHDA